MNFHGAMMCFFCRCDKNARENHKKEVLVPLVVQLHRFAHCAVITFVNHISLITTAFLFLFFFTCFFLEDGCVKRC